jgi:hypothetical protein
MKHYKTYKLRKKKLRKNISGYWYNHVYISGGYAKLCRTVKTINTNKYKVVCYESENNKYLYFVLPKKNVFIKKVKLVKTHCRRKS